ncbi:hypothetical protein M8J75_014803 [Diaphorina citri]|nr:hypothetical protein M8J75_014803 [Diaphorina citri]
MKSPGSFSETPPMPSNSMGLATVSSSVVISCQTELSYLRVGENRYWHSGYLRVCKNIGSISVQIEKVKSIPFELGIELEVPIVV